MPDIDVLGAKKRLMFVKGEDFYFITYNILLLLNALRCDGPSRPFKDHRRLAFLIDFVADPRLTAIINRRRLIPARSVHPRDRHELVRAYSNGSGRIHLVTRLVWAMETKGLVSIMRGDKAVAANVTLVPEKVPADFLGSELYEQERQNISALTTLMPKLRTSSLETTLDVLFRQQGVPTWHG